MTYDDAQWHGDAVAHLGLDETAGGTHIAMFMTWLVLHGFAAAAWTASGAGLADRSITPGEYLFDVCDEQLDPVMLTAAGNEFVAARYVHYVSGYVDVPELSSLRSLYEAEDSWATYDAVAPMIDRLFSDWRAAA
ncbi:hypothetical protein [Nocardioides speluncae]|uniref:DUF7832 domain-containing protein n=1 Tax=Nocardioides speluncae TaxID=2670337 RepID=UPI000D6887AB|nr:hypothetical protein [Nocardioides speluncae]